MSAEAWKRRWLLRDGVTYLNHGSFGPPARAVHEFQRHWQERIASEPMDFYVRQFEAAWIEARGSVAEFVGAADANLTLIDNATAGMNAVAQSFPLSRNDRVLLTDHDYGAVHRIWQRACLRAGGEPPQVAELPLRFESPDQVVDSVFAAANEQTRLLVVSHITSPTAMILPVSQMVAEARRRGIAVCIDGPHAPAQIPLSLEALGCDFYTASLHKWVSAPLGAGFLYVAPQWQDRIQTPQLSWGRVAPRQPQSWWEEFVWPGTRDPSPYLAAPAAIDVLREQGLDAFRTSTHALAQSARRRLAERFGIEPPTPDSPQWYGSMASVPLPPGDGPLQQQLWDRHQIEVPIIHHKGQRSIRVSCHLYNGPNDIDRLEDALRVELSGSS